MLPSLLTLLSLPAMAQDGAPTATPADVPAASDDAAVQPEAAAPKRALPTVEQGPELPRSQAPSLELSGKVGAVRVQGLRRVEEAAILAAIQLRQGEDLAAWKVRRDIKAVYKTGFVDDVQVAVSEGDDGVVVTFLVDEKPAVREVKLEGNKKLDDDALNEVIDIPSFAVLNETDIKENIQRLRDKYVEKGYYLVEIEPVIKDLGDDLVSLTFDITENKKVVVQQVDITGNDSVPDRKIRRFMQTKPGGVAPWLTNSGTFNEDNLANDVQIVNSVFLEEGYVDVEVDPPKVYLSPDKRFIYITIHVDEGPRYKLGAVTTSGDFVSEEGLTQGAVRQIIDGDMAATVRKRWDEAVKEADGGPVDPTWDKDTGTGLLEFNETHPKLETGDWFKLSSLQTTMQEVSDLYGDQGYAFVNVVPLTNPNTEAHVVDITFDIQKGEKVRIGQIDIRGNDPTYDKVIRREIPINEGDTYRKSAEKEARARLERLGYFEEVKISTPRGAEPDVLDMKVEVLERPTGSFSVGAGFSNLENFVFTTNVSKNNFLGLGYVMSVAANVSRRRQQGNVELYDPYFLDSRWTLRINGFSIARQFIEDEYQRGGAFAVGRYLDERDDIRLVFNYTIQDTGLSSIDPYKRKLLGGELYRNGLTSTGGLSLNVDKRNNRINATKGIFGSISADLSGGMRVNDDQVLNVFGGDFNFFETKLNFRAYHPLVPKEWLIFKYNGTMGRIWSTDGSVVPYIHRYRAGGIQSVRGYDWYSLGPAIRATGYRGSRSIFVGSDDPMSAEDRLVVGGTETWINNFEVEIPIVRAAGISTVAFFDAGNAFGDPWGDGHINPLELRLAYGAGIRWFSPMGPLRFEWGFPIDPREDERRAVFDFSIGSLF